MFLYFLKVGFGLCDFIQLVVNTVTLHFQIGAFLDQMATSISVTINFPPLLCPSLLFPPPFYLSHTALS